MSARSFMKIFHICHSRVHKTNFLHCWVSGSRRFKKTIVKLMSMLVLQDILGRSYLGGTHRVFGKPCVFSLPKRGRFDENGENYEFAFYPLKTRASLLTPRKTTKITKKAGVTQAKAWFRKNPILFFPEFQPEEYKIRQENSSKGSEGGTLQGWSRSMREEQATKLPENASVFRLLVPPSDRRCVCCKSRLGTVCIEITYRSIQNNYPRKLGHFEFMRRGVT